MLLHKKHAVLKVGILTDNTLLESRQKIFPFLLNFSYILLEFIHINQQYQLGSAKL